MAYDPNEPHWRKDDDGYDPSRDGPEARMARDAVRRSGRGVDMSDRPREAAPARCVRCNLPLRLAYRVQVQNFIATMSLGWQTAIDTPWPVAVCGHGHREEL